LQSCYERTLDQTENNPEALVEIILGFLSKPSALQRKLSEQVFASLASRMTLNGLKLLLDVLLTPETASGAEQLFDHEMIVEDGETDDGGDDSNGSEDGEEGGNEIENEEEENESDDEEESESGEDNDEMDEDMDEVMDDADEELDAALSAALGTTKELPGQADESSEGELMNDDEMVALDDNLAAIFRQHLKPSRAKAAKDTREQMSTFKCKVVDLLEILIKDRRDLCLDIILPLLQVLRLTKSDSVHSKTLQLLRKMAKSKGLPITSEDLMGLLRKVHEDAEKAKNKDGNIHSQLSIYIARIARTQGKEEDVIGVYAETMRKWVKNGKSMVRTGLFADWVNWCQSIRR
jgi:DNA polymerase phi